MKICNKQQFNKKEALTVLNHCKNEHRKECRIYECPICNTWHLTSKEEHEERVVLELAELVYAEKWKSLQK